ncbi:MAG: four helix bundle protein [Chlamydiae bacterium]|nr:four helix bundle protein [Chlamydiota bacterium]
MGLDYELPIYKDTDSLVLKIFECTKEFSKEYKYTIGQEMKKDALQLLWCIYRANKTKSKQEYLHDFMDYFELMKLQLRLCVDMKVFSIKAQASFAELMDKIGKQMTGWIKTQEKIC